MSLPYIVYLGVYHYGNVLIPSLSLSLPLFYCANVPYYANVPALSLSVFLHPSLSVSVALPSLYL